MGQTCPSAPISPIITQTSHGLFSSLFCQTHYTTLDTFVNIHSQHPISPSFVDLAHLIFSVLSLPIVLQHCFRPR